MERMEKELARIEAQIQEIDEQIGILRSVIDEITQYLRESKCCQCINKNSHRCSHLCDDDQI